jgi:hypothetical protein
MVLFGAICMFLHLERGVCGARYVGEPNWLLRLVGVGDVESARVQRIIVAVKQKAVASGVW